jgi:uncharacterized membrane protein
VLAFVGCLVVLVSVVYFIRRWTSSGDADVAVGDMNWCRELYQQGELSKAEYEKVRREMADQLRRNAIPKSRDGT